MALPTGMKQGGLMSSTATTAVLAARHQGYSHAVHTVPLTHITISTSVTDHSLAEKSCFRALQTAVAPRYALLTHA